MIEWESKPWGKVWHFFATDALAGSFLEMRGAHRCSWHFHQDKQNHFSVLSGIVVVEWTLKAMDNQPQRIRLESGQSTSVPPNIWHRFRVIESGMMIELYTPRAPGVLVRPDDIVRHDTGGQDNDYELRRLLGIPL